MNDEIIRSSNASSNSGDIDKLKTENDLWKSDPDVDKTPTIVIPVSENEFIDTITVRNTTNVKKVIVTVTDANGKKVSCKEIVLGGSEGNLHTFVNIMGHITITCEIAMTIENVMIL